MDKYTITILSSEHPGETPHELMFFFQRFCDQVNLSKSISLSINPPPKVAPPVVMIVSVSVVEEPPLEKFRDEVLEKFSDVDVTSTMCEADDPKGMKFLNFFYGSLEIGMEWKADVGFRLSSSFNGIGSRGSLKGIFGPPEEIYTSQEALFHRVVSLLTEERNRSVLCEEDKDDEK